MKKIISYLFILILTSCTSVSKFGAGVDITFDPRTIGMQIDDTIMQKNLIARLSLTEKKYFLTIQAEVIDGRIFLSGKVDQAEEKIKIGLLVPLTGQNSYIGKSIIKSVRLAINKINNPILLNDIR